MLSKVYERKFGQVITIGLGVSPDDLPMLERVDHPVLVRNCEKEHDSGIVLSNLTKTNGIGPTGWREGIAKISSEYSQRFHTSASKSHTQAPL